VPLLAGYAVYAHWPRAVVWGVIVGGLLAAAATVSHSLAGCLTAATLIAPRTTSVDRWVRRLLAGLAIVVFLGGLMATTISVRQVHLSTGPSAGPPISFAPHDFAGPDGRGEELVVHVRYGWVSYAILKRLAWEAWQQHPWVGIGLGEFPSRVRRAFEEGRIHAYYSGGADPHSTWLGAMAETGLIGLVGLVGYWIVVIRTITTQSKCMSDGDEQWRIWGPLAGLAGLLVNSLHVDVMHFRFLWVGVALLLSTSLPVRGPRTARRLA